MRSYILALSALSLVVPAALSIPATSAEARKHTYKGKNYRHRKVCRHSSGTTGLVAGGAGGALLGNAVGGGVLGTVAGGVGGAFAGRAIDRSMTADKRCR